jgi:hypothetical protein
MLYNYELKKVQASSQCLNCRCFDRKNKKCLGLGKICFEYDPKTKTAIDSVTKLPIKLN